MPHKWLCGFHQALRARSLRLRERSLEPIMDVEVMTPGEFVDSIIGDLNSLQPSSAWKRHRVPGQRASCDVVWLRERSELDHERVRKLCDALQSLR